MRIAVPYLDGNINPAFGRSEYFKLYDIENGKVISSAVIDNGGCAHTGLVTHLKNNGADLALVGNIGQHGADAFAAAGIELYTGNFDDADTVVSKYLDGTLELRKEIRGCSFAG